jgi:hypothetical protein
MPLKNSSEYRVHCHIKTIRFEKLLIESSRANTQLVCIIKGGQGTPTPRPDAERLCCASQIPLAGELSPA